jgi:hypothetical protein
MSTTFDPLPLVFNSRAPVVEGFAGVALAQIVGFYDFMFEESKTISPLAHREFVRTWPAILSGLLLMQTRETAYFLRLLSPPNHN